MQKLPLITFIQLRILDIISLSARLLIRKFPETNFLHLPKKLASIARVRRKEVPFTRVFLRATGEVRIYLMKRARSRPIMHVIRDPCKKSQDA